MCSDLEHSDQCLGQGGGVPSSPLPCLIRISVLGPHSSPGSGQEYESCLGKLGPCGARGNSPWDGPGQQASGIPGNAKISQEQQQGNCVPSFLCLCGPGFDLLFCPYTKRNWGSGMRRPVFLLSVLCPPETEHDPSLGRLVSTCLCSFLTTHRSPVWPGQGRMTIFLYIGRHSGPEIGFFVTGGQRAREVQNQKIQCPRQEGTSEPTKLTGY